jgi:hypothetical protein
MLIVPDELRLKIDKCRDGMSRAEFIDFCVRSFLKTEAPEGYACTETGGSMVRTKSFADALSTNVSAFEQRHETPAWKRFLTGDARDMQSETRDKGEAKAGSPAFSWFWIPALLLFGFGDTLTSQLVFAAGGKEANPFLAGLIRPFGGGMAGFVMVKTVILLALILLSWFGMKKHGWVIPAILSGLGAFLVMHNILSLVGLNAAGHALR